jgi:hypothetical protein
MILPPLKIESGRLRGHNGPGACRSQTLLIGISKGVWNIPASRGIFTEILNQFLEFF